MEYVRGALMVLALIGCGGGGRLLVDAAPDALFQPGPRVFISSVTFGSNLGGLAGADATCGNDTASCGQTRSLRCISQ